MRIRCQGWDPIFIISLLFMINLFTNEEYFNLQTANAFMTGLPNKGHMNPSNVHVPFDLSSPQPPPSLSSRKRCILQMGKRGKKLRKEMREERRKPTPPRIQTPYGPIRMNSPARMCLTCAGRGVVRCQVCEGRGVVRATGHRKLNTVNVNRIIGSRWTSVLILEGHRHYVCSEIRGSKKNNNLELRMSNSCGPEEKRVHLWIRSEELRSKDVWRQGWVTLDEIRKANKGALIDAKVCFRCKGTRVVTCEECNGVGKVGLNPVIYD